MDVVFVTDLLLLAEPDALDKRGEHIKLLALEVVLAYVPPLPPYMGGGVRVCPHEQH